MLCECQLYCLSINAPSYAFFPAKSLRKELNPSTILSHSSRINMLMMLNLSSQDELQTK